MMHLRQKFALLAALLLILPVCAAGENATAPVKTTSGPVIGEQKDQLRIFRGIPFAMPPVGDLRWKPPVRPQSWAEPRVCQTFAPNCPQPLGGYGDLGAQSEDCLYLNVWTAAKDVGEKRPVMVWVHGGGFIIGASSQWQYEGSELAKAGVVLVSFNYRLGPLGFLAHPALSKESEHGASGNYGLMDQARALEWVRDNIAQFGGDPANVTVFGESAGGASVAALMTSPLSKHLFQRAILMSASHGLTLRKRDKAQGKLESMEQLGLEFAQRLGVGGEKDVLKAMRSKPVADILKAARTPSNMSGVLTQDNISVDGWFLREQVTRSFEKGAFVQASVMGGTVADEGTLFAKRLQITTIEKYLAFMNERYGQDVQKALAIYPTPTNDADVLPLMNKLCGDVYYGSVRHALRHADKQQRDTFMYYFTHYSKAMDKYGLGVLHGSELAFVFGNLPEDMGYTSSGDDRKLSQQIIGYFTRFARNGNPNGEGAPLWPAYTAQADEHLTLALPVTIGTNLRKPTLDGLEALGR